MFFLRLSQSCQYRAAFSHKLRMSNELSTHIERTSESKRSRTVSSATVVQVQEESPTVKTLQLKLSHKDFSFKAGQWVDFIVPGLDTVGGFSMCSSPTLLEKSSLMDLAVKCSSHPPAHWVHNQCQPGDSITVRCGGECFWDPKDLNHRKNILLIAGGIGINPIISILQHIADLRKINNEGHKLGKITLLYSASSKDELIFKNKLDVLVNTDKFISCHYFVTKETCSRINGVEGRRIGNDDVSMAVKSLNNSLGMHSYICGPPPMIHCMQGYLKNSGLTDPEIHFEQWW